MTITVYADELLRLTVDDIGDEELFELKDPENETDEHLAHLRRLPSQESALAPGYRSSSASTFDEEKDKEESWQEEEEAYHALIADGGRPSHPVTLGRDVIDNPENYEQYTDILWFWHFRGAAYYQEFRYQLTTWREFREYQEKKRKFYVPRDRWQEYEAHVRESQEDLGCKWDLRVLEDRQQQNRLEDWNEFRAFYYRRLNAWKKRVPPAEQNLLFRQKDLEEAEARLTDVITDPQVLYSRLEEIRASEKEVAGATLRVASAENTLQAAKLDKSKRKEERAALIKTAQHELRSAKANLEHASGSEDMRRLRDGYDLHIAQWVAVRAKAKLAAARLEVKRWGAFLKWIDNQYPALAVECGLSTNANVSEVSLKSLGAKEGPKSEKLLQPPRQRRRQTRPVLSPNVSSRISKPSKEKSHSRHKSQPLSSSVLLTNTTQHPMTCLSKAAKPHMSMVTSAQEGNDDHGEDAISRILRRLPQSSKMSKPTKPTRRSARLAERVQQLRGSRIPSEGMRMVDKDDLALQPLKEPNQWRGTTLTRVKTTKCDRVKERRSSEPQGVKKRRGRSR